MKKIISLIITLSLLGCSSTQKKEENKNMGCSIEEKCDENTEIKKYEDLIKTETFINTSLSESINAFENKETLVLFYGFKTCPWCQDIISILKEEADNLNVKINYVNIRPDGDTAEFDLRQETNEDYLKLQEILKDTYVDDTKKIYVPLVVVVKDGKIISYNYSTVETHNAKERELNKEEEIQLRNKLNTMLSELKNNS